LIGAVPVLRILTVACTVPGPAVAAATVASHDVTGNAVAEARTAVLGADGRSPPRPAAAIISNPAAPVASTTLVRTAQHPSQVGRARPR
jgi:hypothetical protein